MLKGVKEINNYLNWWLRQHHFACTSRYGNDFEYDFLNDIISYSFLVDEQHDRVYRKLCSDLYPELDTCDIFTLSFFHELGHYVTDDDFADQEQEDYWDMVQEISSKDDPTDEELLVYYRHPIEIAATEWGCQYILDNIDEIKKFCKKMDKLEKNFLLLNEVEDS